MAVTGDQAEAAALSSDISVDELREVLGADASLMGRVGQLHAACCGRVWRYARYAPRPIKNEAVILMAAWLWQATAQRRNVFEGDGPPVNASRAFLLSGAQGLLAPWRKPRAGASVLP